MSEPAQPLTSPEMWPAQGAWTYADYCRLPDDGQRYEVIRGKLYVSPAPTLEHQFTVSALCWLLTSLARQNDLGLVLVAPFDVRLPQRIADPVQPDLVFFRKGNEPRRGDRDFSGVPDLVIEVLSPRTRRLDERIKLAAYRDAGIPEVWLGDPRTRRLRMLRLDPQTRAYSERTESETFPGFRFETSEIFL